MRPGGKRKVVGFVSRGFVLVLFLVAGVTPALAQTEMSAWAITTPTIDGVQSPGEWIDAAREDFTLTYCSESHDVTLFVKNDDTYLYLAAVVRNEEYSDLTEMNHDFANFYFDNDSDGTTTAGDDGLAIRFDNTVFRDTHNPNGVNGWSYSDDAYGGTNDIVGAVTHTNPVPDGVGDYTFEYRHPLDSTDNGHDFSLSEGDRVGFRFSFPDGETTCQPVGYHWPSSHPANYADIVIAAETYLKLLFVPLNWTNTQAAFETQVDTQIGFFINAIPLSACPEEVQIVKLDVATQDFDTFACAIGNCGVGSIGPFVTGLGINAADYDVIVGIIENSPCAPIAGCSNGSDTIWVETASDSVAAHELGHIYDLEDEYCSNDAGSTDCRCNDGDQGGCSDTGGDGAATGDINHLHDETAPHPCDCPPDGSNDAGGDPCCNTTFWGSCGTVDYGICCRGNLNAAGGVAIMSYANAENRFGGARAFDEHSEAHFATIPQLQCHSPERPISRQIVDVRLFVVPDGKVEEERVVLGYGRPTLVHDRGRDYTLQVLGKNAKAMWSRSFDIYFDYYGPVYEDVDYSSIRYGSFPVRFKIPYSGGMEKLVLSREGRVIYSRDLVFCDENQVCGTTETFLSCPGDCPPDRPDKVCRDDGDGVCDPDCHDGVDPDCKGECGNRVCNVNENHETCPDDCPPGGSDRYCDRVADKRCDPDCKGDEDPDCRSLCGDGECASLKNPYDHIAGENFRNCPNDCPSGGADHFCDGEADGRCDPDCPLGDDPDCAESRYGLSAHLGWTLPRGVLGTNFDSDLSLTLDFEYRLSPKLWLVALLGHHRFDAAVAGVGDTHWTNLSANVKYRFSTSPLRPYVNGGFGAYLPKSGSTRPGANVGIGLDYDWTPAWMLELSVDYHQVFTNGDDARFVIPAIGVIYRF